MSHNEVFKEAKLKHAIAEKTRRLLAKENRKLSRQCFWTRPFGHNWESAPRSALHDRQCANCPAVLYDDMEIGVYG